MREIVSIFVGQAGCHVGDTMMTLLARESGLDNIGLPDSADDVNTSLFTETSSGCFTPRCVFLDSEPTAIDEIYAKSEIKQAYTSEFFISGDEDAKGCFAFAKFQSSKLLLPKFICSFRRALEECSGIICLRMASSLAGGTGSGCGTTALYVMDDVIPKTPKHLHSLLPSNSVEPSPTGIYNSVIALAQQETLHNIRFTYDNESMTKLLDPIFTGLDSNVTFKDLNLLPSLVTSCLSINSKITAGEMDLIQLSTNLIAYPHMKMVSPAYTPLLRRGTKMKLGAFSMASEAFSKNHEMCSLDTTKGEYLTCWLLFRGIYDAFEIQKAKTRICHPMRQMDIQFKDWIPKFVKQGYINARPVYLYDFLHRSQQSLLKVSNHSGQMQIQSAMLKQYQKLLSQRAFVFHYSMSGMEEGVFDESINTIQNVITAFERSAQNGDVAQEE